MIYNFIKCFNTMVTYLENDFCTYKTEVSNSVCKLLKMKCNRKNQFRVFQRCQKSFGLNEVSVSPKELSQREMFMLGQENELNESTLVDVKRKLFTDDFSKKENNYTSNVVVDYLDMGLNEKILEINNNPFQIEDDCCNTTEEIDYNKNTVSIKEININDDMFTRYRPSVLGKYLIFID